MLINNVRVLCLAGVLLAALSALNAQSVNSMMTVPRTVRYVGSFRPVDGLPPQPVEGVTIAVYRDHTGGDPLWQETQNVQVKATGNFVVEMGATLNEGLPLDLLRTGESRWVGVRLNRPGEVEQPRVQMLSVPYALRASDAETLGGLPASSFMVNPSASTSGAAAANSGPATTNVVKPHVTSGASNYIGLFTNPTDLGNSVLYQNGGKIGLNTVNPLDYFHVSFNDATGNFTGYSVQNLGGGPTSYSGMLFYDQNGALTQFQGFNNSTHEYRINNIASSASINFMLGGQSKFLVANNGSIGIGTSAPVAKLDVAGDINFVGSLFWNGSPVVRVPSSRELQTNNIAVGVSALLHNVSGPENTAVGFGALMSNTIGSGSTAVGNLALASSTAEFANNTAVGDGALTDNTTGASNTAVGTAAMGMNTGGNDNTAAGISALLFNTMGNNNTADGAFSLLSNTTGSNNAASGLSALRNNTTGSNNVAVGYQAALNVSGGNGNNIHIGTQGLSGDSNTIRIGGNVGLGDPAVQTAFFASGIRGIPTGASDAVNVVIDSNGQLGTINSSRRFKEDIQDMADASSGLLRLRPVTYRYKQPYADGTKPQDYGLIAEEVAEVYPGLVVKNKDGEIETVQYQKLTPMLLNELQKQAEIIRKLEARLAALESAKP